MNSIYSHTPIYKSRKSRKPQKFLLITILLFVIVATIFILFNHVEKRQTKAFFHNVESPLVIAHRGGKANYPENTLEAFRHSVEVGSDVIEFDIHMTKDGHLVVIHDATVDRTTDGKGSIDSFTLKELRQLDAGYHFTDRDGNYPYRGKAVSIPTVEEVFAAFPDTLMNIEIKAPYPQVEEKLWQLIQQFNMEDRVLLASFDQKIIDKINDISGGKVAISGGKKEVTKFVLLHKLFLPFLYEPKVDALQIPTKANRFNLVDEKLLNGAKKLNMLVYYWTINDEVKMKQLLQLGANGIITDDPEKLISVMKELGLK